MQILKGKNKESEVSNNWKSAKKEMQGEKGKGEERL